MLAILGFAMIITFMVLIMTGRLSALLSLILIPTVFGLFVSPVRNLVPTHKTSEGRYLLTGLVKVDFGAHQRFTFPWAFGSALVILIGMLISGAVPLWL